MSFLSYKKLVFFITNPVQRFRGIEQYTISSNILLGRGKTISHSYSQGSQALQYYQFSFLFLFLLLVTVAAMWRAGFQCYKLSIPHDF